MQRDVIWMATFVLLVAAVAQAQPQPGIVTLGPAGPGTREIGFSYAAWALDDDHSASSGAARYTYNFTSEIALEGGLDVGSARNRPFAVGSFQVRLMMPPRPFESSKFLTLGLLHADAPREGSPAMHGWGRVFGIGMQQPLSGSRALRLEGQLFLIGRGDDVRRSSHGGLRLMFTIVTGRG